jgi:glucokinase
LIAAAYDQGDSLTREVVDEAARLLGTSIAGIVTVLSLPRVVLGGGLTEALGKPFVSSVKKAVRAEVFPHRLRDVEVVGTTLEDDAGLLGAALLARERLAK